MPSFLKKLLSPIHPPLLHRANTVAHSFTSSGRVLFWILASLIIGSSVGLLSILNSELLVLVPAHGGSYTEGIIGSPRFINPVLAISDADHDLTSLIYAGLLKPSPDGSYEPALASSYEVSDDGRTYTVHIRPDARFQDGQSVTASDVVFTVEKALDPAIKSPLRANWEGIQVSAVDAGTVEFVLQKPYAPFIENLSMGILPKHLWQNVSAEEFPFSELNSKPIGAGPYEVATVSHTSSGLPSSYELKAYKKYALGEPYLTHITLQFYQSEDALVTALVRGDIEGASSISPSSLKNLDDRVVSVPLSRVFGVFFNQNQNPVLRDASVRKALSQAIDRDDLVSKVLGGYGTAIKGPIPPSIGGDAFAAAQNTTADADLVLQAQNTLASAGWKKGEDGILVKTTGSGKSAQKQPLAFTLSTGNIPELNAAANYLKAVWGQLGAQVTVEIYDQGDLSENVIRPRKYDALLFGEIVGRGLDLFAFWHSSQRNDPGLNIAMYANSTVDAQLTALRETGSESTRAGLYEKIQNSISEDMPAVFLYSPNFVYAVPKNLSGLELGIIEKPSDRFNSVEKWYRRTDHVWQIFTQQ